MGMEGDFRKVGIVVKLSSEMNYLLTQSALRSKRTKTMEALVRLEDHLINFYEYISNVRLRSYVAVSIVEGEFRDGAVVFEMSPKINRLLTQSALRSKRTKTTEAYLRLEDHLNNFPDIATAGRRFREDGTKG